LDFEGLSLLYRDTKTNSLFSIESSPNEEQVKQMEVIKQKKQDNIPLTQQE
jgi:hypothetical protein